MTEAGKIMQAVDAVEHDLKHCGYLRKEATEQYLPTLITAAKAQFAGARCSDAELLARIRNYLGNGGLFNPEMMEHNKVRDLIMDCGAAIERHQKVPSAMMAAKRLAAGNYTNWNNAGGGKECEHGYNEGIPCPACDLALVNECLEREHQNGPGGAVGPSAPSAFAGGSATAHDRH